MSLSVTILAAIALSLFITMLIPIWHLRMQETQVSSLGGEDLLEKEMATHSSILA